MKKFSLDNSLHVDLKNYLSLTHPRKFLNVLVKYFRNGTSRVVNFRFRTEIIEKYKDYFLSIDLFKLRFLFKWKKGLCWGWCWNTAILLSREIVDCGQLSYVFSWNRKDAKGI